MSKIKYSLSVFINCPFDKKYLKLRNVLMFTIYNCGLVPRCALEEDNSGNVRFEKIKKLIENSMFGIHDLSRIELDGKTKLPRFNMPLELGIFLGAKFFGEKKQKTKNCLVLDSRSYRYQAFISDMAGHDIKFHENKEEFLINAVRSWIHSSLKSKILPGGKEIFKRYIKFKSELPIMCKESKVKISELTYNEYSGYMAEWLKKENDKQKQKK